MPDDVDPDLIEMDPPDTSDPGEIEMEGTFVGRSTAGEALAAQAAQARHRLLQRLEHDQPELAMRIDRPSIALKGAEASLKEAETSSKDLAERRTQLVNDRTALEKQLAAVDPITDPVAHQELVEEIAVHAAVIGRQDAMIKAHEPEIARYRTQVEQLTAERDAAQPDWNESGPSLRAAEEELDRMERRATLLDAEDNHMKNAEEYTRLATAATQRGDGPEAARLRGRAAQDLEHANVVGRELSTITLDPTLLDKAGLVDQSLPDTPAADPLGEDPLGAAATATEAATPDPAAPDAEATADAAADDPVVMEDPAVILEDDPAAVAPSADELPDPAGYTDALDQPALDDGVADEVLPDDGDAGLDVPDS